MSGCPIHLRLLHPKVMILGSRSWSSDLRSSSRARRPSKLRLTHDSATYRIPCGNSLPMQSSGLGSLLARRHLPKFPSHRDRFEGGPSLTSFDGFRASYFGFLLPPFSVLVLAAGPFPSHFFMWVHSFPRNAKGFLPGLCFCLRERHVSLCSSGC